MPSVTKPKTNNVMSPSCHQQYIESRQSTYPQLPKLQTRPSFQQNLFERIPNQMMKIFLPFYHFQKFLSHF